MNRTSTLLRLLLLITLGITVAVSAIAKQPAVLFTGGLHLDYFAKPLHAEGIELHTCGAGELPTLLPTGKYNVVVVTGGLNDAKIVAALQAFMAAGGGVLTFPGARWDEHYLAYQHFLEGYGAHYTMSLINDTDPARVVKAMFCNLYATESIAAPFNAGVPGLLFLAGTAQSGISCPVSIVTDANWTAVVKASPTATAVGWAEERIKSILPYVTAQPRGGAHAARGARGGQRPAGGHRHYPGVDLPVADQLPAGRRHAHARSRRQTEQLDPSLRQPFPLAGRTHVGRRQRR